MKYLYTTLIFSIFAIAAQAQNCSNLDKYYEKMRAADSYIIAGNYSAAQDNYNAAKIYCEDKAEDIEKAKEDLFNTIDGLRLEAERQRQIADEKTLESQRQRQIAQDKTLEAQRQKEIAESKTLEIQQQKEIVESKTLEAQENLGLFALYASIQHGFLEDKELSYDFLEWVKQSGREGELYEVLPILIKYSESMDEEERIYWNDLLEVMTTRQKGRLLDILGREAGKLYDIRVKYGKYDRYGTPYFKTFYKDPVEYLSNSIENDIPQLIRIADYTQKSEKNLDLAILVYQKVLELDNTNIEAMKQMGYVYSSMQEYRKGYDITLQAIKVTPENYSLWYSLSFYSLFVNKPEQAIEAAKTTLKLNPEALGVETNLALGYLLQNDYSEAEKIYLKWKGKKFKDNDSLLSDEHFVQDILDLEAHGIQHPDFEKVKVLFEE